MDEGCFDRLPRRFVLGGLGAMLGSGSTRIPDVASAKQHKKLKRNEFGCVNVGGKCTGKDKNCCSGICAGKKPTKGKKDTSRCQAHDASTCLAGQHPTLCGSSDNEPCATSLGDSGNCATTTGAVGYCFNLVSLDGTSCTRDTDCREEFGAAAACIVCPSTGAPRCVGIVDF
jgi:hypothetical protein